MIMKIGMTTMISSRMKQTTVRIASIFSLRPPSLAVISFGFAIAYAPFPKRENFFFLAAVSVPAAAVSGAFGS